MEIPLPANFVSVMPTAIDTQGDVVGSMSANWGTAVPFLYMGGIVYDLTSISGVVIAAIPTGINQAGQIVFNTGSGV